MKYKVQQQNRKEVEEINTQVLDTKNEVVTIIVSEKNMNFIALHHPQNANTNAEDQAATANVGDLPAPVTLSFDSNDNGGSYKMVFTDGRDKITISDFYNLLTENVWISQKKNYKTKNQ